MKYSNLLFKLLLLAALFFASCRGDDEELKPINPDKVAPGEQGEIKGFFLLNEANMGSNKATIDYFDYETGTYFRNIYPYINPNVVHELGDVGNDLQIYGSKLYAVLNTSGYIEVMDVNTAKHVSSVVVQNCRYMVFHEGFAYVSSYNGPVKIEYDTPLGCVVKIDTATMQIVAKCTVGYQPEEMVIRDNKLYVANSGGYRVPDYDNTLSVIDLNTFKETHKITVAINLHRMEMDNYGNIYVSSRGDYRYSKSNLYIIGKNDLVVKTLNLPCSEMTVCGDSVYVLSVEWSHITHSNTVSYALINTETQQVVSRNFITDGTEKQLQIPYGIAVNPDTKDIYVTDAKDYVSPGVLYCFSSAGKRKWSVVTGDTPAHFVFTRHTLQNLAALNNH